MKISMIGMGVIAIMSLIYDTDGTLKLVTTIIGVRGITWLVKRVTANINFDAAQIIDFAGWSIAGVSIVKIISNAMGSVAIIGDTFTKVGAYFEKIAAFLDKAAFWS